MKQRAGGDKLRQRLPTSRMLASPCVASSSCALPAISEHASPATIASTHGLHAAANVRPVGQVLPHAGSPCPFLPSLEDINASPVPLGELLPLLPQLLLSGRRFLDRATASFHESTSPNELAWALQVLLHRVQTSTSAVVQQWTRTFLPA